MIRSYSFPDHSELAAGGLAGAASDARNSQDSKKDGESRPGGGLAAETKNPVILLSTKKTEWL
jgi:hypothetical protein